MTKTAELDSTLYGLEHFIVGADYVGNLYLWLLDVDPCGIGTNTMEEAKARSSTLQSILIRNRVTQEARKQGREQTIDRLFASWQLQE